MGQAIGTILMLCIPVFIMAGIWTYIIGFAGAPGAFLAGFDPTKKARFATGWIVCAACQCYMAVAFVAFVVAFVHLRSEAPGIVSWPLWIAAFFFADQPVIIAARDAMQGERDMTKGKSTQHTAIGISCIVAPIMFFVFAFAPKLMAALYGWVPYVGTAVASAK